MQANKVYCHWFIRFAGKLFRKHFLYALLWYCGPATNVLKMMRDVKLYFYFEHCLRWMVKLNFRNWYSNRIFPPDLFIHLSHLFLICFSSDWMKNDRGNNLLINAIKQLCEGMQSYGNVLCIFKNNCIESARAEIYSLNLLPLHFYVVSCEQEEMWHLSW